MPVRDKAVEHLLRLVIGNQDPPKVALKALLTTADALYVRTMDSIDWKRVMHDAATRHMELHDGEYLTSSLDDEHSVGEVCSECLQEAMLANEFGGVKSWKAHPRALRDRLSLRPPSAEEVRAMVQYVARHFIRPDAAHPDMREDDGHLMFCEEIGRMPNPTLVCDPACPHYEGWIEELA